MIVKQAFIFARGGRKKDQNTFFDMLFFSFYLCAEAAQSIVIESIEKRYGFERTIQ